MNTSESEKMKIEIWSDIACPFCYIGKHKIDKAIAESDNSKHIEVIWKSYLLNPELVTDTSKTIFQSLSENKNISIGVAKQMSGGVSKMGQDNGIVFNFDKIIPANTLKAHQLLHFAKHQGKQSEAKEMLFKAYFIEGRNIDDMNELSKIISELKLNTINFFEELKRETYLKQIELDLYEAHQIGVRAVPFFVFNNHIGISGAQDDAIFKNTLHDALKDWMKTNHN
jgi:predicted DsbA family dithiol-disulfide isomerase